MKIIIKKHTRIESLSSNFQLVKCKMYIMPSNISDADINALFNGILLIVKKKIELETKAEFINMNTNCHNLLMQLREKQAECNRLKNEIIYLKSQSKLNLN